MSQPRVQRPVAEMVDRLREHTELLRDYLDAAKEGDRRYLGDIAAKCRLLVIDSGSNKALLYRLCRLTVHRPKVRTGELPPGMKWTEDIGGGEMIDLSVWLGMETVVVQTPSSDGGLESLTNGELILVWAQQSGGAHEDWSLSETFHVSQNFGLIVGGIPANDRALIGIASQIRDICEHYLEVLKPQDIERAEENRWAQLQGQ